MAIDLKYLQRPWRPWDDDCCPLDPDEALYVIRYGQHRAALEGHGDPEIDRKLIRLINNHLGTCALRPDGVLGMKPTRLAIMQQFN